jgi:hypothetical protein
MPDMEVMLMTEEVWPGRALEAALSKGRKADVVKKYLTSQYQQGKLCKAEGPSLPDDICAIDILPVRQALVKEIFGKFMYTVVTFLHLGCAFVDTSIVHEDIDLFLFALDLFYELLNALLFGDIALKWNKLPLWMGDVRAPCLNSLLQSFFAPTSDIHACAVIGESLGNHETDARATASDNCDIIFKREEGVSGEPLIIGHTSNVSSYH